MPLLPTANDRPGSSKFRTTSIPPRVIHPAY
jgi:hypothetical protein